MIATGLVFLLGALVATLLALLFVPLLWRNAQRLARRDFAATMPATMNEIRAEVDRVRAESAMTVRRHEMLLRKARERHALERATVGRLTTENAELTFSRDQHTSDSNSVRGQLTQARERIDKLEEARASLEAENAALKEAIAASVGDGQVLASRVRELEEASVVASASKPSGSESKAGEVTQATVSADDARARVTAAAAALIALAGERRDPDEVDSTNGASTASPAREAENAEIRDRVADIAANVIRMTGAKEGAGSPLASVMQPQAAEDSRTDGVPTLAERVSRLTAPRETAPAQPVDKDAALETSGTASVAETPAPVTTPSRAKRRRGGARSRQRSQH